MNFLLLALFAFAASPSFAASDSVAVIVRPEKALVQVNEAGAASRLQNFLQSLGRVKNLLLISKDESFKLECGRNGQAASCVFRILPGGRGWIRVKAAGASAHLSEMGLPGELSVPDQAYEFRGSNGDQFVIRVQNHQLSVEGTKR